MSATTTKPRPSDAQTEQPEVLDPKNPAAKPQGTTQDQVKNMEAEGQAQPQADEVPPDPTDATTLGDKGGAS